MAKVTDLTGIKQLIQPLEESGTLVRRTNEEVFILPLRFIYLLFSLFFPSFLLTDQS